MSAAPSTQSHLFYHLDVCTSGMPLAWSCDSLPRTHAVAHALAWSSAAQPCYVCFTCTLLPHTPQHPITAAVAGLVYLLGRVLYMEVGAGEAAGGRGSGWDRVARWR